MSLFIRLYSVFLVSSGVFATTLTKNETLLDEVRRPRVTGRIVKLYSGTRPEPILCTEEGFQVDPADCAVFYRCVKASHGKFTVFRFQCGPGTIYDPETEVCNHPKSTKRYECGSFLATDIDNRKITNNENEIESTISNEIPKPINTNKIVKIEQTPIKSDDVTGSTANPFIDSSKIQSPTTLFFKPISTTSNFVTRKPSYQQGDSCVNEGFMGDSQNCRKFYRCVGNGRGGFIRYEFSCSESTIWDDDVQSCNHPSSTKRNRCGRGNFENNQYTILPHVTIYESFKSTTESEFGSKVYENKIQINKIPAIVNKTENNFEQHINKNKKQENQRPKDKKPQFNNYLTYEDQNGQIDENMQPNSMQNNIYKDEEKQEVTQPTSQANTRNKCTESGFQGDPDDCKFFYRCVDNGQGSFTQYQFSCGEGTVWDPSIEACNHEWAVKDCGNKTPNEISSTTYVSSLSTATTTVASTTQKLSSTESSHVDTDEDSPYGNQDPISDKPASTEQTTSDSSISDKSDCKYNGFIGDKYDCKKFYRCVDNGQGSFTKYEFTCGEGTVWDPLIEACNHAWAVDKCGGTSVNDYDKLDSTTKSSTTQVFSSTNSVSESIDYDTGYGQTQPSSISTTLSTTHKPSNQISEEGNICSSSGFMGDKADCRKFYRCVDNGKGGYTRYEFSCGEGTVWDENIEGCNHAWAAKDCSQSSNQSYTTEKETSSQETSTSDNSPSEQSTTPINPTIGTTTQNNDQMDQLCTEDGFVGDKNDCKKFYRCVDNGHGSYTKYEFSCGEGTVWDQEIKGCNHPTTNKSCGSNQNAIVSKPDPENDEPYADTATEKPQTESSPITIVTTENPQTPSDTCQSDGFYGDSNDCKKFYRCVDNGKGGYAKYEFTCGDGTVWDQEINACNHESEFSNCKKSSTSAPKPSESSHDSSSETTTESSSLPVSSGMTVESDKGKEQCESEGFYANSNDCKKFYRCVSNGHGGYTKYDFSCGEGTVWVQEIQGCDHDNDINNCSSQNNASSSTNSPKRPDSSDQSKTTTHYMSSTTESGSVTQADENPNESFSTSNTNGGQCTQEGFYGNDNDCTKFYRCVDNGNGGFTKYDFACGEGTAWDSNIQACNHINEVENCDRSVSEKPQSQNDSQNNMPENSESSTSSTTVSTTTSSTSGPSSESSETSKQDKCSQEGYYGNSKDCKKFYRCVDNGKGGYTKYDYACGEGTIWDQDITACNHPRDVNNPSCNDGEEEQSESGSTTSSSTSSTSTQSSSQSTSSTTESNNNQENTNCTQENSTKQPGNKSVNCTKAGFYGDPNDCKKFYRCVDWDGDGKRFSVYHFECGEGTIWDPSLDTCNHEDSVYPPRDCSGTQNQGENVSQETTTSTTTDGDSTTSQPDITTTETTTTQSQEDQSTTPDNTTTEQSTTKQTTTQKTTTQATSTTAKSTTTQQPETETTPQQTTTQQQTTSEQTTTQQTTVSEKTTTQQSTTSEQTTTEPSTSNAPTTTQQSSTSEQTTTQQSSSSEQTTTQESSATEQTTTQESTTTEENTTTQQPTSEQTTTEQSSATDSTTSQQEDQSTTQTTQQQETTTEQSTSTPPSEKDCPETDDDQNVYVCPTGFRRHPKYCNMFYQCTEDDETHEVKVAVFNCPNNTIYDEGKTQCVEENKADKKCDGEIAQRRRFKRLDAGTQQPMVVSKQKHNCPTVGHFPFEKEDECSPAFLKCERAKSGKIRGLVYQCPENFVYWSVSRRCEPKTNLRYCKQSANNWSGRWEIPVERKNVASSNSQ